MRDSDVRRVVKDWLEAKYAHNSRIVEEMGIWSGSVRIDIAVINGKLHGFELKSERDTLVRLENQAALYSEVFDRVTLVTAKRHYERAASKIPSWWGITCVFLDPDAKLEVIRKAQQNPRIDPHQLARLLWRPEALAILEKRGLARGYRSCTAEVLVGRLVEVLSFRDLAEEVREALKSRAGWLGKAISDKREMAAGRDSCPDRPTAGSRRTARDFLDSVITPTSS